jgi:hypothetical protein
MKDLLNGTFFNFVLGFFVIIAASLTIIMVANYYEITLQDAQEAAAAFLFGSAK